LKQKYNPGKLFSMTRYLWRKYGRRWTARKYREILGYIWFCPMSQMLYEVDWPW
jgi:hypothetical protein